ncbi:hypothetical protein ACFSR9_12040 [Deinococcus taklimakanensis]|uniref:Uncharacterized protein n=1 Tax=Deinococcus taklimakanensis TaxID=536443 RepID=A0ABW5P4V4_9DEIO
MIWRDTWVDAPGVVIISEQGQQNGELDAVLLALRLDILPGHPVEVTNEHGTRLRAHLPRDVEPFSVNVRITLTVEVTT